MNENQIKKFHMNTMFKKTMATVAALAVLGGAAAFYQTQEVFAQPAEKNPAQNTPATITNTVIHMTGSTVSIDAVIPEVNGLQNKALQESINKKVWEQSSAFLAETKREALEVKKAWLETGGSEKDYILQDIGIRCKMNNSSSSILSFAVSKYTTRANVFLDVDYYNYDLKTGAEITLKEALSKSLGSDYIKTANTLIKGEIEKRSKEDGAMYFDGSNGIPGFAGITDHQNFYLNENGRPVVVFNKYEIAPGYMGVQEFELNL